MASIQTSIKLNDQMTTTLNRIQGKLDEIISKMTSLEKNVSRSMDNISKATDKVALNEQKLATQTFKAQTAAEKLNQEKLKTEQLTNKTAVAEQKLAQETLKTQNAVEKVNQAKLKTEQVASKMALNEQRLASEVLRTQINAERLNQQKIRTKQLIDNANNSQKKFNSSINHGVSLASSLGRAIRTSMGAYLGYKGVSGTIGLADNLQMTKNRLDLLNDGLQTTAELQDKIYESAMRSRAGYLETADAVAKLGLRTGNVFKNMDETIAFNETLNKMFVIAGTGEHERYSATLQLTQALGSGVLRGQEFIAVFEAAPNVMQAVAKYMDVPIGKLKDMAAEGLVTSEIVKNAMFQAAEETNAKFKKMQYTFGHIWTGIKNSAVKSFEPVLKKISAITNSQRWVKFIDGIGVAIDKLAVWTSHLVDQISIYLPKAFDWVESKMGTIKAVFNGLCDVLNNVYNTAMWVVDAFINNWSLIEPIVWGLTAALLVHYAVMGAGAIVASAKAVSAWIAATWSGLMYQVTLFKMAVAQYGFNAALAMCPLTWFIYAIIAVIALFYLAVAAVNKFAGTTLSATGMIVGAVMWLGAVVANIFIGIYNIASGIVQAIVNAWNWASDNMYSIFYNIGVWWNNLWIDAEIGFNNFIVSVLDKLSSLARKIQPLADLLDIDLSGAIEGAKSHYTAKSASLESSKMQYKALKKFESVDWKTQDYFNLKDAYNKGYEWGANLSDSLGFDSMDKLTQSIIPTDLGYTPISTDLGYTPVSDAGKYANGGFGDNPALQDIADNTKNIANTLDTSEEDLSYMRDLAEREAINRYTLTDLKVEQNNNNNFANGVDSQGMLNLLKKILHEGVTSSANGVHF